jgi:H+-transporting ATPase
LLTACLVMEIAVLISAGLREWIDFGVIIAILLLNATVGWYQEKQAADVVASLKGDIAMRAAVVRDGKEEDIKARELVPGDIVCFDISTELSRSLPVVGHHRRRLSRPS